MPRGSSAAETKQKGLAILPALRSKSLAAAYLAAASACASKGFEVMYMLKKGQFKFWQYVDKLDAEIRLITNALLAF